MPKRHELLTDDEVKHFPFCFDNSEDYRMLDRMAGLFEALGLEAQIIKTRMGYVLILDLPEADT